MMHTNPRIEKVVLTLSWIPVGLYLGIAIVLSIVAVLSLYQAGALTYHMISSGIFNAQLVFVAIFQTITAIVLFETTVVFFMTQHIVVQTLLIAGLTETVRHILIFDVGTMEAFHLFALVGIMAVLIAGIILLRGNEYLVGPNSPGSVSRSDPGKQ